MLIYDLCLDRTISQWVIRLRSMFAYAYLIIDSVNKKTMTNGPEGINFSHIFLNVKLTHSDEENMRHINF